MYRRMCITESFCYTPETNTELLIDYTSIKKKKEKLLDCLAIMLNWNCFSSIHFSRSVMSNSLWPHESQHARPSCPSPTPGVHSNSCPLSQWCHPTISSSVVPFSSCHQSFAASGSFKWVSSSHQVAKILEFQLQHQSFQLMFRTDFL